MKLRHTQDQRGPVPLILSGTNAKAMQIAQSLGISAHVRGVRSSARGLVASGVLVDAAIWPLSPKQLEEVMPCIAGQNGAAVARIELT